MTIYKYLNVTYNTLAEAEAAVTAFKNLLDNQPSTYCEMKELTGNNEEGWTPVTGLLTDAEMIALDDAKYYYIYSQYDGEAHHGLTGAEATAKKNEIRNAFATRVKANTLTTEAAPSNEDMSIYVI